MNRFLGVLFSVGALAVAGLVLPLKNGQSAGESLVGRKSAPLPVLFLNAKAPIQSELKVPCTVTLNSGTNATRVEPMPGVVRFHGASSQGYPKKSFGVTLEAPVQWLGMQPSAHWVFNAAFVDRSMMRHKLAYDLFRSLSSSNAPRHAAESRFVDLQLNGAFNGLYLLMERVDRRLLGLQGYRSNALHHACIYKAIDHAANFDRPGHFGYEQREPDPLLTGEYWGPLDRFNRFVSSADDAAFFDPEKGIATRLDLGNTMDFHLLILVTCNVDGFDKNLILARDAPSTNAPLPRFFFVPWDYDATFGRSWDASRVGPSRWLSNHLFDRLLADRGYRGKMGARWKELRGRQFAVETIFRLIDENREMLGTSAERNAARWRGAEEYYPDRLTLDEDIEQMKAWITRRMKWLDTEIARRTAQ